MNEAQQARLCDYLDAAKPLIRQLRERGWPVEIHIDIVDGSPVVSARLNVDDTRVPVESA